MLQTIAALGSLTKVLFAWLLMLEATGWCGKETCLNGYAWASTIACAWVAMPIAAGPSSAATSAPRSDARQLRDALASFAAGGQTEA